MEGKQASKLSGLLVGRLVGRLDESQIGRIRHRRARALSLGILGIS